MSPNIFDHINDVFVLSLTGVPFYANCFGGEICKMKPDHLLQSGFISAMFTFAEEFGQKSIIQVEFEDGRMIFSKRTAKSGLDFIVVFFTSREADYRESKELVEKSGDIFQEKFGHKVVDGIVDTSDFKDFTNDLFEFNVVNRQPMGDLSPLLNKKKKSIWQKLFG